jgi:hypothetical protein
MSILPQGYANVFSPLYETDETPDAINVITGSGGIVITRTGNTVNVNGASNTSPLTILSPDGTKTGQIAEGNDGSLTMTTTGQIAMTPGTGVVVLGNNTNVGGSVVSVNGPSGLGRVYDTVYNIPPAPSTTTATVLYTYNVPGNQRILTTPLPGNPDLMNLTPGKYQLNAYYYNIVPSAPTTNMDLYIVQNGTITEMLFSRARLNKNFIQNGAGSYNATVSGTFTIPTAGLYNMLIALDGTATDPSTPNLWTSDYFSYQLVKLS